MDNDRQRLRVAERLQPPAVYLLGLATLIVASPLESLLGEALARFVACLAFNGALYAFLRTPLALANEPLHVLLGAGLGVLVGLPALVSGELALPGVALGLLIIVDAAWEELLFRGLAFDFAVRRYGSWGALILSTVFFAGAHLLDAAAADPLALAYLVLAGLMLGAIRLASASLWPALALHAAHNVVLSSTASEETSWGSVAIAAGVAAVLLVRLRGGGRTRAASAR